MATVETFKSPQALEDFLNGKTFPPLVEFTNKRGFITLLSEGDFIAGLSDVSVVVLKSEDALENYLNNLSNKVLDIVLLGQFYAVIQDNASGPAGLPISVTLYKSPDALATGTGLTVTAGLDESGGSAAVGDLMTTWGGLNTLIEAIPPETIILQKGAFYIVIESTPPP